MAESVPLPPWAEEMRRIFRGGAVSQFILHGNVFDLVRSRGDDRKTDFTSLREFLAGELFQPFEVVLFYDRGKGIRVKKGADQFQGWLKVFDSFNRTDYAGTALAARSAPQAGTLDLSGLLPKDARRALELVDRFLRAGLHRVRVPEGGGPPCPDPLRVAVVIDYANFVVPPGEPMSFAGELAESLIKVLDWASDPGIAGASVVTVLLTENLTELHRSVVENPYAAKIRIDLPAEGEIGEFLDWMGGREPRLWELCELPREALAGKLVGLSRIGVQDLVARTIKNGAKLTPKALAQLKKDLIEKQCRGLLEFVESRRTLDDVAGHHEAKAWLRGDAELLRRGKFHAVPMGYLINGRIGTGKTFLVECWSGEIGIPCVELKNFRDRWVGATEGNLETIFTTLRALGQVVVFVDEADQATGKRQAGEGDSGLSGRVYAMLAKEMSDTRNRGKIIWVFATSRPDLVEVDLKRPGRLDVHIPLFPPQTPEDRRDLFLGMARKVKLEAGPGDLPELPPHLDIGGNEMEALLVKAARIFELQSPETRRPLRELILGALEGFRPSAHSERLEFMDLVAVKECTDQAFLPDKYKKIGPEEIEARLETLRRRMEN